MSTSVHSNSMPNSSSNGYRPATISELAARAQDNLWDPSKGLKHWLRTAEKARKSAEAYTDQGNIEAAFVDYARAATIVLEKLPTHRDYQIMLSADQRHNLGMNGQDILDSLSHLKPVLVKRFEQWTIEQDHEAQARLPHPKSPSTEGLSRDEIVRRRREEQQRAQEEERAQQALEAARREEEWKREQQARRQLEDRERTSTEEAAWFRQQAEKRREAAEARRTAEERERAVQEDERQKRERRRQEQEGILQRQREAAEADEAARREIAALRVSPAPTASGSQLSATSSRYDLEGPETEYAAQTPRREIAAPQPSRPGTSSQHTPFGEPRNVNSGMLAMPLESPTRYDDDSSTDVEGKTERQSWTHRQKQQHYQTDLTPTKARHLLASTSYPPAITTTSPAPPELGLIRYPSLMSQHQLKQGYVPSLHSMFSQPPEPSADASLLFDAQPDQSLRAQSGLYENILPNPSTAATSQPYATPFPNHDPHYQQHPSSAYPHPGPGGPSPSGMRSRPQPPVPTTSSTSVPRIVPGTSSEVIPELKTIRLPRECLPRFLSIARVNTLQNRETCGLLLGKDKGNKYVVTTLLIPKQRATSDTCTMDEEELVLSFTEDRHLITLGWIHTHPTQSCFMSSVDLHTHSGFQRMLPESFAVVCAPNSTPTFGIFRLTNPGGLQTILRCTAKEAFHPHPQVPIYTDCDNSHVQMKDISLEIVDLRS